MDPVNYYITTITTAFKNIAPILAFLVGGYLIFIKGPFLFLRKSMNDQKKKIEEESRDLKIVEKYTVDDYNEFKRKMKLMNETQGPAKTVSKEKTLPPPESKRKEERKEERKEKPKSPERPKESISQTPEEIFNFRPGESFSQGELKKRYFDLLKQNHPDRVASMGPDFKKLAEKNTKDINKAFETLKKKAG